MKRCCTKCGNKLVMTPATYNWDYRDNLTGEKIETHGYNAECLKKRWWNSHDEYFISKDGGLEIRFIGPHTAFRCNF